MLYYKEIGQRIRLRRIELGYDIKQLAEMTDINYSQMSGIENGRYAFNIERLDRISRVLNLPVQMILYGYADTDDPAAVQASAPTAQLKHIVGVLCSCPIEHMKYLEAIVENFIQAIHKSKSRYERTARKGSDPEDV